MGSQVKTGAWDVEEDNLLSYWQSKVGNKWSEVAKHIPGRTGQQCAQRWRHKVNPNIRRDKWTAEEDAKLIELVKTFGVGRWAEIARNCHGRTDQQCMGRWRRHLDPNIRRDSWTPEEDAKLRQLHAQHGTSWSRISKNLKGRTSQQCRARWHQINNTRSKSCGSGAGSAPAAAGGSSGRQASGRKAAPNKRKSTSRRRQDSSCSEDDEDEEDDYCEEEEEDFDEAAEEQAGSSGAHPGPGSQQQDQQQQQQQQDYAAAVAAAAAAGYGYGAAELQQPWVAMQQTFAAGVLHGALSAGQALQQQAPRQYNEQQQQGNGVGAEAGAREADAADDAADPDSQPGPGSDSAALTHHKSLPARLDSAAPAAAGGAGSRPLRHTGSLPSARRAPAAGGGCMSPNALWPGGQPPQYAGGLAWSPSRLLLSPQRPEHRARGGRLAAAADLNEEETAGAETLLEMASLLQQESCELQPAQLPLPAYTPTKRPAGDRLQLPAYTPPKRPAGDRLEEDLPDGLSPSPYKRARSSRLFAATGGAEAHEGEDSLEPPQQHSPAAGTRRSRISRQSSQQQLLEDEEPSPQPSPAAAASGRHRRSEARHFRVPQARPAVAATAAAEGEEEEEEEADEETDAAAADESPTLGDLRARGAAANVEHAADPAGRPSNASSFTGLRSQDAMAAAAAAVAAAVFMSPTREARGGRQGAPGSATATPNRQGGQHHNVMGMLSSPLFERMVGCATPPSAGRTQPSAATLAALQSPQPSRVPEPFWTPFTGLFQDALFSRGTSATPDLPSAGKPRLPRGLFSPAAQRSASASGGKVAARRGLLAADDVCSPLGASGTTHDMENDKPGSQPSGGSAERPSAAAAADAETGPSPAAACGVHPPLSAVHHRVVRRLDQHEAWGASRASPSKHGRSAEASSKQQGLAAGGTGFSMFSPVKKQRVPLFNETATIKVGATPSKPEAPDVDQLLPIAPLKHSLPEQQPSSSAAADSSAQQQQQQQHLGSPPERLAAASGGVLMHGRSPLGAKARDRASSGRHVSLPLAAASPGASRQDSQQQQQEATAGQQQQQQEEEEDQVDSGLEWQQVDAAAAAATAEGAGAHEHAVAGAAAEVGLEGSPGFERAGASGLRAGAYDVPYTPINVGVTADNTSCSGTPNTPAGMRADATGGRGQMVSPNDYVTPPQHRLRASRPLAPLHKDCLIAAATRSLADGLAAQQRRTKRQPASSTGTGLTSAAAAAEAAVQDSPGQCSSDSSKMLSCERDMDSPLEATGFSHSPSQWHQGMVAMLRGLQRTPLQTKDQAGQPAEAAAEAAGDDAVATAAAHTAAAGPSGGSPAVIAGREVVGSIKVCSRALRRLQDELEHGSSATAAAAAAIIARQQQRQQGCQRTAQLQQHTDLKDSDAEVPFAGGLSLAPGPAAAAGATPNCSTSTPLVLPLFTTPTAATASRLPAKAQPSAAVAAAAAGHNSTTPLALQPQSSSAVASVSLTPAVVTLHTPAASAAMSAITPCMPAVAWPVQQRSDGGLMVSAPMTGVTAAAAVAAAAGPTNGVVQLTPAASTTKVAAGGTGATPFPAAASAAAPPAVARACAAPAAAMGAGPAVAGGVAGFASPLSVISIQPLTLLASACNAAAGQAAALQSVLTLQPAAAARVSAAAPGASSTTPGVPEQLRAAGASSAAAAAAGGPGLRDSSHAVRSRLHALIDSV